MTDEELNRLMAERVMGWYEAKKGWWEKGVGWHGFTKDWNPATDANDALRVVEAMRAKGWLFRLRSVGDHGHLAEFYNNDGMIFSELALIVESARAICLAAAKAVGDE